MPDLATILRVYLGSDGEATKALYAELERLGEIGVVAMNLFRACKASERAKVYRGRNYRGAAYDKKAWSMNNLCSSLSMMDGITWGWGVDERAKSRNDPYQHVLYIDIPTGQVSFHTDVRGAGPDYEGQWDGVRQAGVDRICRWTARLFNAGGIDG